MSNSSNFSTLRAIVLTAVTGALFSAAAQAGQAYRPAPTDDGGELSRAEVIADTNLWVRAGADKVNIEARHHGDTTRYEQAVAEYQRLRSSPAYAEEVARVAAQRGEVLGTRFSGQ